MQVQFGPRWVWVAHAGCAWIECPLIACGILFALLYGTVWRCADFSIVTPHRMALAAAGSGQLGLELAAGSAAAAAAAAVDVHAPTDGAQAGLQVREGALAIES